MLNYFFFALGNLAPILFNIFTIFNVYILVLAWIEEVGNYCNKPSNISNTRTCLKMFQSQIRVEEKGEKASKGGDCLYKGKGRFSLANFKWGV